MNQNKTVKTSQTTEYVAPDTGRPFRLSEQTPEIRATAKEYARKAVAAAVEQGFGEKVADMSILTEISGILQTPSNAA